MRTRGVVVQHRGDRGERQLTLFDLGRQEEDRPDHQVRVKVHEALAVGGERSNERTVESGVGDTKQVSN